jgi:WD40 repeat protein
LFDLRPTDGGVLEVVRLCETHEAPVIGLSFNDSLKVFAASSTDSVIKIYTTDKQLVRSIRLINPCPSVHFHGDSLLVAQKEYVLSVPKSSWDSDNYLKRVRANTDINWDMPSTEEEDSNISAQLLRGINRAGNAIGADTVVDNTVNTAVATAEDGDEWERASVDSTRGAVDYFSALDINVHGDSYKSLFSTLPAQPKSSKVLTPRLKAGRNVIVSKREDASSAIRGLFRI